MKTILFTLLCAVALTAHQVGTCATCCGETESACLTCDSGFYVKGFGGLNVTREPRWHHTKYRTSGGYALGAALGYKFGFFAVEGEFSYRHNRLNRLTVDAVDVHVTGDVTQMCGMGNVLMSVPVTPCFAPYVGAGAGYRHFKPGVNFDEGSDRSLRRFIDTADDWGVYQAIAGLNFGAFHNVNVQLEYRYMDGWSNVKCANHTVDLGATIRF